MPAPSFQVPVARPPSPMRRRMPFLGLVLLLLTGLGANAPALAVGWDGEAMAPLPQYSTYCQTYGDRDPGCPAALGGRAGPMPGPDRLIGKQLSLGMALHVHRQVVADLTYVEDKQDVWQVLGTPGTGMSGDCDDVVMTTIARLLRRGYPRAALRATIVQLPGNGGHHLILGVRLAVGEVFLDDRHRWQRTATELQDEGYRFVAQEVPGQSFWRRAKQPESTPTPKADPVVADHPVS